ncbi:MAG: stress response protein [Acidimicrobiia bacterium]
MGGDEAWQRARLIPTWGINGPDEAERRATSALLAVLGAVREFSTALLRPLGAPIGAVETFIEVEFSWNDLRRRPDGLVRVRRGQREWVCLVEVKTGAGVLEREQLECYLDIAREQGFDAVLTISNQIAGQPGVHPVDVDKRKLKRVGLYHLSWAEVLTAAVVERVHRTVADPDQAWILGELIRYLEAPSSGALAFTDLGGDWVAVRDQAIAGTLRTSDKGAIDVARRWDQLLRLAALRLGRDLGADVQVVYSRKHASDPSSRLASTLSELTGQGCMSGTLRIAGAVGPISVTADIRHGILHLAVNVPAPTDGRPATRVNWLVRQLPLEAPREIRIEAWAHQARQPIAALLADIRDDPTRLIDDPKRELRAFRITLASRLGVKRGVDRGSLVGSVIGGIDSFYEHVVQNVRPWAVRAPRLPREASLAEAGIDTAPEPEEPAPDYAPGPEGTVGGADRTVARDEDGQARVDSGEPIAENENQKDRVLTDAELAEWMTLEVSSGAAQRDDQIPIAEDPSGVELGLQAVDDPLAWAPPQAAAAAPLPPPATDS